MTGGSIDAGAARDAGDREPLPRDLGAVQRFARLMDEALPIPWTRRRFGLDAVLGLVPGVGDAVGALLSSAIILAAVRHRVRPGVLAHMVWNVVLDLVLGAVPVAGDLFDMLFEENVANLKLLLAHRDRTRPPRNVGLLLLVAVAVAVLVSTLIVVAGIVVLLWLSEQLQRAGLSP